MLLIRSTQLHKTVIVNVRMHDTHTNAQSNANNSRISIFLFLFIFSFLFFFFWKKDYTQIQMHFSLFFCLATATLRFYTSFLIAKEIYFRIFFAFVTYCVHELPSFAGFPITQNFFSFDCMQNVFFSLSLSRFSLLSFCAIKIYRFNKEKIFISAFLK